MSSDTGRAPMFSVDYFLYAGRSAPPAYNGTGRIQPSACANPPLMPAVPVSQPLRVCSFESRRADDMRSLIERHGGVATVVPSMREIPLAHNESAVAFGRELLAGEVDVFVFLTGVGAAALLDLLDSRFGPDEIRDALRSCKTVVRGPKPVPVLRERGIPIDFRAAEPNTWREVVDTIRSSGLAAGKTIAIQEYGEVNVELKAALESLNANVVSVPIYRWDLPEDISDLESAVNRTIEGEFDALLFTSAQQVVNVARVATSAGRLDAWKAAANRTVIGSIGPTCSEAIRRNGLHVTHEANPTKMGQLVSQTVAVATGNGTGR